MKKSILFITAFPPCTNTAGQDYTRRVIEKLVELNYKVSLIYFNYVGHKADVPSEVKILKCVTPTLRNCLKNFRFHPFFTKRFDTELCSYINRIAKEYDLLYFDFSQIILYSCFISHPAKLLMCHDVIYQRYSRRKIPFNVAWIKKTEAMILRSSDMVYTFSGKDCKLLKDTYDVISQPVNFYLKTDKYYQYTDTILDANTFCFYGAWNRKENTDCLIWFINNVLGSVMNPHIRYNVIGGGMNSEIRSKLEKDSRFRVLGFVDNPLHEIAKCQALIAPLRHGAGVKVKVVDAMSTGTMVIGTKVAFEGIEDNNRTCLMKMANTAEDYIKQLNNWQFINIDVKKMAAKEFFDRYDTNHITEKIGAIFHQ